MHKKTFRHFYLKGCVSYQNHGILRNFFISLSSIICPGSLGIISAIGFTDKHPFIENGCKFTEFLIGRQTLSTLYLSLYLSRLLQSRGFVIIFVKD